MQKIDEDSRQLAEALEAGVPIIIFDQIAEAAGRNERLRKAASANSLDKFQLVFWQVLESLFIERMELNEELFAAFMGQAELQTLVSKWLGRQVYERLSNHGVL